MKTLLMVGDKLFKYGFPNHPLSPKRFSIFYTLLQNSGLLKNSSLKLEEAFPISLDILELFHTKPYINKVKEFSKRGYGYLDMGDTPVYPGIYEYSLYSVGATVRAITAVVEEDFSFAVNVSGGWHHAKRDSAAGFCIFNDICVGILYAFSNLSINNVYYIDIDAHHGDGVYYSFEDDPRVYIFDIHEDGRYLYPGTGFEYEKGRGVGEGTKINIPLPPYSGDELLLKYIKDAYEFGLRISPDLILVQGGMDGLAGDPLTHLQYTVNGYLKALNYIFKLAEDLDTGLVFLGGGGYQYKMVAEAWLKILSLMMNL